MSVMFTYSMRVSQACCCNEPPHHIVHGFMQAQKPAELKKVPKGEAESERIRELLRENM